MGAYQIGAWQADRLDPVVDLHHRTFALDPEVSLRYLRWKYFSNPYLAEPILFIAQDSHGRIAGMRGFYGSCWRAKAGAVVVPCADDFAIAEPDRNTGLMSQIMRTALDELGRRGHEQLLNLSGGPSTVLQSLAMGWTSLGPMKPAARISRSYQLHRSIADRPWGRKVMAWARGHRKPGPPRDFRRFDAAVHDAPDVTVASLPRIDDMAALAGRLDTGSRVRHVRDAAWFRWRFSNPMREYRFLYHERRGALTGYLIVNRQRTHVSSRLPYHIVDWEAESDEVRARLLQALLDRGRLPALGSWTGSMSVSEARLLARLGFKDAELELRARGLPCALIRSLAPASPQTLSAEASTWDIRLADSMHG